MSSDALRNKTIYNNALYWWNSHARQEFREKIIHYFNDLNRIVNGSTVSKTNLSEEEIISLYTKLLTKHSDQLAR